MVNALTYTSPNGIELSIITPVLIKNVLTRQTVKTTAIWDTGATGSVVTKEVARLLDLKPVSKTMVNGVHGSMESNVYNVNITLNNDQITQDALVTECVNLSDDNSIGMLIGMNIITLGDFCITNHNGRTTMTFRVPSLEKVDYVSEIGEHNKIFKAYNTQKKHGNEKCPCGSGKNFKNCHGKSKYFR